MYSRDYCVPKPTGDDGGDGDTGPSSEDDFTSAAGAKTTYAVAFAIVAALVL